MDDIVLERGETTNVMKLDDDEQAMLNEIEIQDEPAPRPRRPTAPKRTQQRPAPPREAFNMEDVDAFTNPSKAQPPRRPQPEVMDYGDEDEEEPEEMMYEDHEEQGGEMPSPGYATVDDEKADLLNKLTRLEKKGLQVRKFNAYSNIDEIRTEYKRVMYGIEID